MVRISVRPDSPVCKQTTLTGKLTKYYYEEYYDESDREYSTICQNIECKKEIYLDNNYKVIGYWKGDKKPGPVTGLELMENVVTIGEDNGK